MAYTMVPLRMECVVPFKAGTKCPACNKPQKDSSSFKTHARKVHHTLDPETPTTCTVCARQFRSYRAASAHYSRICGVSQPSTSSEMISPSPSTPSTPSGAELADAIQKVFDRAPQTTCLTINRSPRRSRSPPAKQLLAQLAWSPPQRSPRPSPPRTKAEPTPPCESSTSSPPRPGLPAPTPAGPPLRKCPNPEKAVHNLLRDCRRQSTKRRTIPPPSDLPYLTPPPPSSYEPSATVQQITSALVELRDTLDEPSDDIFTPPPRSPLSPTLLEDLDEAEESTAHPPRASTPVPTVPTPPRELRPTVQPPPETQDDEVVPPDVNNSQEMPLPEGDKELLEDFQTHWLGTFGSDLSWTDFSSQCEAFAESARALAVTLSRPTRPAKQQSTTPAPAARRPPRGRRIAKYNPTESRRLQGLYRHSKKRAARKILSANSTSYCGSRDDAQAFFTDVFAPKHCDRDALQEALQSTVPTTDTNNEFLYDTMTSQEVSTKLRSAANTAPGPDRVEYRHLKRVDPQAKILVLIYARCLQQRDVPQPWKDAVTILIHKKGPADDVSNFRPIALMSCLYKLFTSVLGRRLASWSISNGILSSEQKSARPAEGCYEHTYLLQSVIGDARRNKRSTFIAWLDLRNAFGSVPHQTIEATLQHVGIPESFVELVMNVYTNATTSVRTEQGDTASIPLNAGVKQGCPMSPILFNLCLELVLRSIKKKAATLSKGSLTHFNTALSVLAYADDLVIMARSKHALQLLLDAASASASVLGLQFRPDKCATLSFVNVKHQNQRVEENTFHVQDCPIPALSREESYRYLGVPIGLIHNINDLPSIIPKLVEDLTTITDSLLAPWQKLDAIRTFIQPCLTYALRAGNPSKQSLDPYRTTLIHCLRTICDLPNRNSQSYFFAAKHAGGLAFQDPTKEDDVQAIIQAIRILSSDDATVTSVARNEIRSIVSRATACNATPALVAEYLSGSTTGRCANLNYAVGSTWTRCRNACRRLKVSFHYSEADPVSVSADDSAKIQAKSIATFLHRLVQQRAADTLMALRDQGKVAQCLASDQYANGSTWTHTGLNIRFKDWRFIHKARLNLLPTNAVKARFSETSPSCRHCAETETLPHILCHCRPEMVSIRARHDKIVNRLTNAIRFGEVTTDRAVTNANSRLRPDIIVEEDNRVIIIDVTCPFDNGQTALEEAANAKIDKYLGLKDHFVSNGKQCEILPFVVGALGSWYPSNEQVLNRLGMTRSYKTLFRKLCCSDVIQGSCDIFRLHLGWDQPAEAT